MEFANIEKKVCFVISDKKKKDIFISIFSLLKNSSSCINLNIDKTTFHIQGMDKSHVCLFDLKLHYNWFDYYKVDKKYNLCFSTSIFYSIINIKSEEQSMVFYLDDDNNDILLIEFKNNEHYNNDYNKFLKLPLIDYDYEELQIQLTEYDVEFSMSSKKVTDILSQFNNFGDDLNIICSEDYVDFITSRDDVEIRVNIPANDLSSYSIVEGELINLTYSLVHISKICLTNRLTNDIDFNLSVSSPTRITYNLEKESVLMFYIAPKVSSL